MFIYMLCIAVAYLWGFLLSIYFFIYRLNLSNPWRWPVGIIGGLILGFLMALIEFFIIWPPVTQFSALAGSGLILLITLLAIGYPTHTHKEEA